MDLSLLFPLLLLLLVIPIFLSGRRQRRQMTAMQQLQSSLTPGDEVMTTSGLRAIVVDTSDDDSVELEIAPGVTTTWIRAAIRERINPATDVEEDEDEADADTFDGEAEVAVVEEEATKDTRSNGRS